MSIKPSGFGYGQDGDTAVSTDGRPGTTLYVGTTAPAAPMLGDLWIDNAAGYQVQSTKGDLAGFNGTTPVAITVGATGTVLTADPTTDAGVAWAYRSDEISSIMGVY